MAKKAAPPKKGKPMSSKSPAPRNEAKPLGKAHERVIRKSEAELIAQGRERAAQYLVRRDGMDLETATMVVEGMESDDVEALVTEANTAVMERTAAAVASAAPKGAALHGGPSPQGAGGSGEEDEGPVPDFQTVKALAKHDGFADLVVNTQGYAKLKNESEKKYKEGKKEMISILSSVKAPRVEVFGIKLAVYRGSSRQLDEHMLLEAGVSADTIKRCWKVTEYDDVRMTVAKKEA